ncbi:unnamed protein product [Rhizoctonia solani]|uniref:Uncharacterized protein n=1 Tax=Rhizoctonia solani TaxID=456999 RepID=A0A8H3GF39_9AGAM|nr:unnamed protein product [Rhizoctonia solani]
MFVAVVSGFNLPSGWDRCRLMGPRTIHGTGLAWFESGHTFHHSKPAASMCGHRYYSTGVPVAR